MYRKLLHITLLLICTPVAFTVTLLTFGVLLWVGGMSCAPSEGWAAVVQNARLLAALFLVAGVILGSGKLVATLVRRTEARFPSWKAYEIPFILPLLGWALFIPVAFQLLYLLAPLVDAGGAFEVEASGLACSMLKVLFNLAT